jgi:hypothetical protein
MLMFSSTLLEAILEGNPRSSTRRWLCFYVETTFRHYLWSWQLQKGLVDGGGCLVLDCRCAFVGGLHGNNDGEE